MTHTDGILRRIAAVASAALVATAGVLAVAGCASAAETDLKDWDGTVSDAVRYADNLDRLLDRLGDMERTVRDGDIENPSLVSDATRLQAGYRGLTAHPDTTGVNIINRRERTERLHDTVVRESKAIDAVTDRIDAIDRSVAAKRLKDARTALDRSVKAGEDAYRNSDGRVLDTANRDELKRLLDAAASDRRGDSADQIGTDRRLIDDRTGKVDKDVKEWEAEQARRAEQARQAAIAARQAAARRTAAQTTAQATAQSAGYSFGDDYSTYGSYYETTSGSYTGVDGTSAQGGIDQGGMVRMNWGDTVVYGQHANTGGAWINNLQTGQTVTIDGQRYRVDGREQQGAVDAPTDGGQWLQTCNGNGNHLVGITPIG